MDGLFQTEGFMPRGGCHFWTTDVLLLQLIGNLSITVAYFAIPIQLLIFIRKMNLPVWARVVIVLFASFVLSCGVGHAIKVLMIWWPAYRFEGWWDMVTAVISLTTSALLIPVLRTARKTIEPHMRYSSLIEHTSDGHWVLDPVTGEDWVSPRYLEVLGYEKDPRPKTVDGWLSLIHPEDREAAAAEIERAQRDGAFESKYRIRCADGTFQWHLDRGRRFGTRFMGAHTDITALMDASERNRVLLQMQEEFTRAVSHDIREPLRTMRLSAEELADPTLPADDREFFSKEIVRAGDRGEQLLSDLGDFMRAGRLPSMHTTPVSKILGAALTTYATGLEGVSITIEGDEHVHCAVGLVTEAVENLVGNAIKFAQEDVPLELSFGVRREGDDHVAISVTDNGIGIDPGLLTRAIQPFIRLHSSSREGSGMGLAIVHRIITAHGGTVSVNSPGENQGATITCTLPAASS